MEYLCAIFALFLPLIHPVVEFLSNDNKSTKLKILLPTIDDKILSFLLLSIALSYLVYENEPVILSEMGLDPSEKVLLGRVREDVNRTCFTGIRYLYFLYISLTFTISYLLHIILPFNNILR